MTTAPTTFGQRAAEYLGYQTATRPRLRRFTTFWLITHTLVAAALGAAPPAAASTLAGALNWTGVTDSHGVPVGSYYLSVVSTSEAITKAGPSLSVDPSSWARWLANAVTTGLSHELIVELLQAQAAVYIFMIALSLWLLRFAMSNTWLLWLATWFRPVFETIRVILADLWVFPICLLLGLAVGAFHILWHGRKGFGSGIMLSTLAVGVLGILLTRDPLSDLYSENGLLTQGRNLGFSVSQAAFNNGSITSGGGQAQLQHLTGLIADATVRMPLQLMNFGTTVDDIGTCGRRLHHSHAHPPRRQRPRRARARDGFLRRAAGPIVRPAPQRRQPRTRQLLWATRGGLRLLRLLRHLQLRHGVLRGLRQCTAVHRGRRARHDPRAPAPARRAAHQNVLQTRRPGVRLHHLHLHGGDDRAENGRPRRLRRPGGYDPPAGPAIYDRHCLCGSPRRVLVAQTRARRSHPPRIHPRGHRPRPPRPRRLPTRTRRLRPRPGPQLTRPLGQKPRPIRYP